jgi:hypothetical protein
VKARARTAVAALVLLAAAGGALVYAWYGVERRGEAEAQRKEKEERLFAFEPGEVTELAIEAKGTSTRLVREGSAWRIPALSEQADPGAAGPLVDRLARLKRKAEIASAPDAAALGGYGLAAPRIRVELTLPAGRKESLAVGAKSDFDGSVYVRTGSGAVFLVAPDLAWWLDKGTEDLRDRTAIRFEQGQVKALRAEAAGKVAWAVERQPGRDGVPDGWSLTAPRPARAQAGKVSSALQALSWLRALHFADDTGKRAAELGLDRPRRAFVLLGEEGKEIGRVEVGKEVNDGTFVRSSASPRILEVDKGAFASLPADAGELEEKPEPPRSEKAPAGKPEPAAAPPGTPGAAPDPKAAAGGGAGAAAAPARKD